MKHKNGSLLRRLEDKLCNTLRLETLDSSDDFIMQEGQDDEFKARLLALSEPYSTISQILEEFRNKSEEAGSISRKDISYIHGMIQNTGITMEDFDKDLDDFEEKITSFLSDKNIVRARLYDYCCELFSYNFFQELVKALLTKYGEASDYESFVIFSGANRTVAERNTLCDCDKDAEADVRGCEKCDPIEVLLSSEIIRLYRNKALYLKSEDLQKSRSESQLEKILIHFKNRKKISMKPGIELKLYATFFHILGCNEFLWEKSPRTIEEIWENYPVTNTTERLRETIDKLLQNNHGWGKEGNYVDYQGRMSRLENALSLGAIITIWGEGGLGKTELVYQTLSRMLKEESHLKFDELIPFTFKGSQGEFNFRGSDDTSAQVRPANQIGWSTAEGISPLITILAHRQSEIDSSIDLTRREGNSNAAVDYLIENDVWLIIDNHEVQDDGVLDEFLELYAKRIGRGGKGTRIIITTRVPPAKSIGTVIAVPGLDVKEMKQLAQNKVVWDRKRHGDKAITSKFSQPEMFQNEVWEQINTRIQNQLKSKRLRKAAGHPYVVFAAVHRALYDEKYAETEFDEIVLGLIKQFDQNENQIGVMHDLQTYIFGQSFKSLINEDNKEKFLHLTQYSELSTRVFRDKVGFKQWEELIEELSRREIIILKPNQDSEDIYEWRTGYHPKLIQDYLKQECKCEPKYSKKWDKYWDKRISQISNNKTIRKDTLATINVGSATQTNKDNFKEALEILNFEWLLNREEKEVGEFGWDFNKLVEILIHFSELYLELIIGGVENENFPISDKSETTKAEFLDALELIILNSLDGLANYLRFIAKNELIPSYKVFTVFVDILKRSKDRRTNISELQEKKQLRDISPFLQTYDTSWNEIYSILIQNTPPHTRFTSTQHDALLQLGSFEEFGPVYLFALLPQFGCAGPIKDQKLLKILVEYSQQFIAEKQGNDRNIAIPQNKLQSFSKYIYDTEGIISSNGTGNTLGKEFFLEFDNLVEDGNGESTLFKRRDVKLEIHIKGNTLIGTDEDENTWKIYNCTSNTEVKNIYEIRCIPFFIDGEETIHAIFVILKDVLEILTKPTIPSEKNPEIVNYIPIEAVSAKQMWSVLKSIQFQSIPAATLFGDKLKEELKKQKIQHTGKVWRTWRNKEYPKERLEEEVPEGYDAIEFIIQDLSAGEWSVLELNAGKNKTIRKLPKEVVCQNCEQSVEVTEEYYDEATGKVDEIPSYCLSCDHTIDRNGFCMAFGSCLACEGYPICEGCNERENLFKQGHTFWCDVCEMAVDDAGRECYDEDEERRRIEREEKREQKRREMIDRVQDEYDSWNDRSYQKRGKGRW